MSTKKRPASTHDTLVYRLSEILTKLNRGESLDPQELASEFGVTLRTIQRDLNVRFSGLPLAKTNGRYAMDQSYLGKLNLSDVERFAKFAGVRGLFPDLSVQFLREILASDGADAWLVMGHHYEDIRALRPLFAELERAIVGHRHVQFRYSKVDGKCTLRNAIEPYKLVNQKGIWYLAAWEAGQLKSFAVSRIDALMVAASIFVPRPHIEDELAISDGIWFGRSRQRMVVQVNSQVAQYFLRRELLPNQSIVKRFENGDLLVTTTVAHTNEVLPIVRYWIPHVRILEPVKYQQLVEKTLADYLGSPKSHN